MFNSLSHIYAQIIKQREMRMLERSERQWRDNLFLAIKDNNLTEIRDIIKIRQDLCDGNDYQFSLDFMHDPFFSYFTPLVLAI